jgi:large repetitive protein
MRLNRPLVAVKVGVVTGLAAAACAMSALPAGAATAAPQTVRYATKTEVSVPKTGYTHTPIKLSAYEAGPGGNPTGTVTFYIGTRQLCHGSLYRRRTSCDGVFADPATKTIVAKYSGNRLHLPSSGSAVIVITNPPPPTKYATTTTITNPNPGSVDAGDPYMVDVTVTSASGTPTGTVVVAPTSPTGLPPSYSCTATLSGGKGSCNVTPGAGTFGDIDYKATYGGDAQHTGSVSTGTYELIVPETTTTTVTPATAPAGSVTLTATVIGQDKGNISPSAGGSGTVTFTITQGATTVGTCSAAALTYDGAGANLATCTLTLATGSYSVQAVYSGDPNNLTSTGTETLTVS